VIRIALLSAIALLFTGCATKAVIDYDADADFSKYRTFAWKDSGEDLSDTAPLWHDRVVKGIQTRLEAAGNQIVTENPDAFITYYSAEKQETTVVTDTMGYGVGSSWRWGYGGVGATTSHAVTYDVGTLIVDVWDASENKLVWRATATDTLYENPEKNEKLLNQMLDSMVEEWQKEKAKMESQR